MSQSLPDALASLRAAILDAEQLVRAVASGRRRGATPTFRRIELRWVDLRAGRRLQVVSFDERQSFTRNVAPAEAAATVDDILAQPYGNWIVEDVTETIQLRVTKKGEAQVHRAAASRRDVDRGHDRQKPRMLDTGNPFLRSVGICDDNGAVKPSRTAKYRQVDEFLRAFVPVFGHAKRAAADVPVHFVDLGCGNAYLTFATHAWLEQQDDLKVNITGIDVKEQSKRHNEALSAELGWTSTMSFVEAGIDDVELDEPAHAVFALHACDTATDDALAQAVRWEAPVILAAPCCHHDVQRQLDDASSWPAPYGMLARQGILRERFADTLTDALRATILRLLGYRVDVIEFVDSAHTPRNTLLRAVRTGSAPEPGLISEYHTMLEHWGVEPALAARLGQDFIDRVKQL